MPTSVGDHPRRIDLLVLGVGELVPDDEPDHLRRDAQPAGGLLLGAADEQPQGVFLEAVGVGDVLALEGRNEGLAVMAMGAAMEGGLVDPEAGLAPQVEVADDLGAVLGLQVGRIVVAAAVAADAGRQGPGDFKAVPLAVTLIGRDGHVGRQIDVDGDGSHDFTSGASGCQALPTPGRHLPLP